MTDIPEEGILRTLDAAWQWVPWKCLVCGRLAAQFSQCDNSNCAAKADERERQR